MSETFINISIMKKQCVQRLTRSGFNKMLTVENIVFVQLNKQCQKDIMKVLKRFGKSECLIFIHKEMVHKKLESC